MLTQATPPLVRALEGVLPPGALKQLTQALGNCNQPLTHRGDINIQPGQRKLPGGVSQGGQWNPADYPGLLPAAGSFGRGGADIAGFNGGDWNSNNYYGDQFFFPTNQEFFLNNYYGGPTTNFGGNTFFDNSTHNNINVQFINNLPAPGSGRPGPAGPPGQEGPQGVPGEDGAPGDGGGGGGGFRPNQRTINYLSGKPEAVIKGGRISVLQDVTFDPDTCQLIPTYATVRAVDRVEIEGYFRRETTVLVPGQ